MSKFNFFYFEVVRVCSFVCCNGVCDSGISFTKINSNGTLQRDTREFNAAFTHNHVRQFVYEDMFFVSQFYRDLKMTTDGSQQNHIEFLKCVTVVTFSEVQRIVADWM